MEENKMGTVPVSRLVISMGLPLMLSLLISSLYNFVDSVFVARVSEDALTAISLAAPMQLIVSSLGLGNAVGLNAVISRALGEKNPKKVKDAASAAIFIACCSWILNCILCLAFARIYFESQSGGNEAIASYGIQYLSICMMASFGQMGQWVFDRFVMASGKSHLFIFTLSADQSDSRSDFHFRLVRPSAHGDSRSCACNRHRSVHGLPCRNADQ